MRLSSSSFFSRLSLSLSPSFSRRNPSRHASRIMHHHHHHHLPFANPFPKHTDLSFPRRATTISSRTRKTRKPARRRTRKRRRCTSRARNREVRRRRRRRRPECSARRASFWKGEFYSDFERKRDVGCTLSFFLSFACVRPAQRREVFQMFLVFSLSFSLFFSLSLSL